MCNLKAQPARQKFSCASGYTGVLCSQCLPFQFNFANTCNIGCDAIEPRVLINFLLMLAVLVCWLMLNKMTAGVYAPRWVPRGIR